MAVTKGKGQKILHEAEDRRVLSEEGKWVLFKKGESCSFLHSLASGNPETSAKGAKNTGVSSFKPAVENERRRKGHPLLYRREKDRLTTNARKVQRPDLRLELKFLVYGSKM